MVASVDDPKPPRPCVTEADAYGGALIRVYCVMDLGRADYGGDINFCEVDRGGLTGG